MPVPYPSDEKDILFALQEVSKSLRQLELDHANQTVPDPLPSDAGTAEIIERINALIGNMKAVLNR